MPNKTEFLIDGPKRKPKGTIILAHGAGAPMDSEFMNGIADGLSDLKIKVVRFEFPYMAERRLTGKKKPPNTAKILCSTWLHVISEYDAGTVLIGGKSMGGRMASMVADEAGVSGCVCLGYPFHPPGKPEKQRTEHLESMKTPTLILQGERDTFGNLKDVKNYKLSRNVVTKWLKDGDHSFRPRKSAGISHEDNLNNAVKLIAEFIDKLNG